MILRKNHKYEKCSEWYELFEKNIFIRTPRNNSSQIYGFRKTVKNRPLCVSSSKPKGFFMGRFICGMRLENRKTRYNKHFVETELLKNEFFEFCRQKIGHFGKEIHKHSFSWKNHQIIWYLTSITCRSRRNDFKKKS